MREQDGQDVGMCMDTVEQVRSRRSSEEGPVSASRTHSIHQGTDGRVRYCRVRLACRIVSSVKCQALAWMMCEVSNREGQGP